MTSEEKYDAIIVGGGFRGVYHLIHLREKGLKCLKLIEAGSDLGGVWHWHTYPGARVDTDILTYEFSRPELWEGWTWTERFPSWKELQAYFKYVDNAFGLRKDCRFDSRVKQAHWDDKSHTWHVTSDGKSGVYEATAHHLIMCTGFGSKPYIPELKGLETFKGAWTHTARWPKEGIETSGKRVGIIGTGASGVQVIQGIGENVRMDWLNHGGDADISGLSWTSDRVPTNAELCNTQAPIHDINKEVQDHFKQIYERIYQKCSTTAGGFFFTWIPRRTMEDSEEERLATFQALWDCGGFHFWLANYKDAFVDKNSNDAVYAFWRKKVSERVKDPKKLELLAPEVAPHPFGCKRPSLEQHFYEIFNQENVDIVDLNATPILEVTPRGVKTTEGERELDVLIFATGFDSHTGAFMDMDLQGINGETIQDHWRDGTITYLGMTIDNFPNLFFVYGPQGPTEFCNGPTCVEIQGNWVVQTIEYLGRHGITKFTPTSHSAQKYKKHINVLNNASLLSLAIGPYNGANIPGKPREPYNYAGSVPAYKREIMEEIARGYPGFQREALIESRL